jgi:methionyl-tRNA formyltransferase
VLLQESITIEAVDTAGSLHDRLAALGAQLIVRALTQPLQLRAQPDAGATYAPKIDEREARIDWSDTADVNDRKVRAFNPFPGAATDHAGVALKVWRAGIAPGVRGAPGAILHASAAGITVACGTDALTITELQRAGGRRLSAGAFLSGCRLIPGERLGE